MRLRSAVFALVSVLAAPSFAQASETALTRYIQAQLYPILWTYEACAIRHLRAAASAVPASEFDHHEFSIKPACGAHIDRVRVRLLQMGWDPATVEVEIQSYYSTLRPKLIVMFETERLSPEPVRVPSPRREVERGDDASLEQVRDALMRELGQDHRSCIARGIEDIVPHSAEGAETLTKAVMARCMDFEKKRRQLLQALYEVPREQASRVVEKALGEERLRVLAAIVTFRATLAKREMEGAPDAEPGTTGGIRQLRY
jgi:hypothetical protein